MRQVLSIVAGLAAWLVLRWMFYRNPETVTILPLQVIDYLRVVEPSFRNTLLNVLPWIITGLLANRRSLLCGALAAAITSAIRSADLLAHMPEGYWGQFAATTLTLALISALYGAAGAALGASLKRSNNSFKPKPLRGSA